MIRTIKVDRLVITVHYTIYLCKLFNPICLNCLYDNVLTPINLHIIYFIVRKITINFRLYDI